MRSGDYSADNTCVHLQNVLYNMQSDTKTGHVVASESVESAIPVKPVSSGHRTSLPLFRNREG